MIKVALYARVSSERQAEKDLSIPTQIKALRGYALKHGWEPVKEFIDEAESARTANRPEFQRMIAEAKQKPLPFNIILVWKLSRFARNREDSILYKTLLRKRGVQVVSINEQIDETPTGKLLEGMIESIDEFYSANLGQDTRRGMKENATRGFLNGAPVAFGYRAVFKEVNGAKKRTMEVNEEEACVVRQAFELFVQGEGAKNIAQKLNADGLLIDACKSDSPAQVMRRFPVSAYWQSLLPQQYGEPTKPKRFSWFPLLPFRPRPRAEFPHRCRLAEVWQSSWAIHLPKHF